MSTSKYYVRGNFFSIKPEKVEAFKLFIKACGGKTDINLNGQYTFSLEDSIPSELYDEDEVEKLKEIGIDIDLEIEFDFAQILSTFLDGDSVLVVFESVSETNKSWVKYAGGSAIAINSKGEKEEIYTDAIYNIAKKLGTFTPL